MTESERRSLRLQAGPAPTAVERVADAVRAEILSGALAADEPLREEAASERYGVSRHTVRAAFQRLVAERLAVAAPYRGVRVASFDRETIIALQQLRAALEVEAVRIAGERYGSTWPDAAVAPMRAALEQMAALGSPGAAGFETAAGRPPQPAEVTGAGRPPQPAEVTAAEVDWLEAERLHADFHQALVAASASPRIIETHTALGSELLLFLLHVRPHYTLDTLVAEHRALLDDVQTRGPEAIREHLEHSTTLLVGG